jgi:signal transduction histidine kinase/ActR/RegA family two-component response regulator
MKWFGSATDFNDQKLGQQKLQDQLVRLNLLDQITRAIAQRQDLQSVFQVVLGTLEENLPIDFGSICTYDGPAEELIVSCTGVRSAALAAVLGMTGNARMRIDQNGLGRCLQGQFVYEPDTSQVDLSFPARLAHGGLRSLVIAPLLSENNLFGILVAARRAPADFSSADCEFLRQLSGHVALAAHQAQIYAALQQAYNDLRQTQQAAMQQERLRALGQMASGIAHDINNALSPVALYTEALLEREPNLSPRTRQYLETAQRAIDDVAHTVARMREFYRQREPQVTMTAVHLNRLVQQVVDLTRARWSDMPQERGFVIQMRVNLAPDLPTIAGVESEIREALTNLIFNAVDAMPAGGVIEVRTRLLAALTVNGPRVQLELEDTGIGMDEKTRSRCLEPFFTTKGERGTGLGLAMVYGMAQRQNAEIEIESAVGQGTRVRLNFRVPTTNNESSALTYPPLVASCLRILIVDDDPIVMRSVRDTLEMDGHAVTAASGGKEAIETFRTALERNEHFAAVITDLGMPHVDGRKVASAVKASSPTTPVILLTGWGQRLLDEEDLPPNVDRVLNKPPKIHQLRSALAELAITPPSIPVKAL